MKIAQFDKFGTPSEVVKLIECEPETLGPQDVRIQIEAAPVHIADLKFMSGELPFYKKLPGTPGMEGIGRVIECGNNAQQLTQHDRVFLPVRVGEKGAFRTEVVLRDDQVVRAPDGDAAQLSLVPINGTTAFTILNAMTPLKAGDLLLQNAANSNCGRYIITLAKSMGIGTINIVRRPELVDELKGLGADHVLLDGDDIASRVHDIKSGRPLTFALDAVAGQAIQRIADCVSDSALILSYGMLSGEPCTIRPETLFFRDLTLKGFLTFIYFDALPKAKRDEMWEKIPALIADGHLNAKIAATYSLEELPQALEHAGRTGGDRDGKIIILPNG